VVSLEAHVLMVMLPSGKSATDGARDVSDGVRQNEDEVACSGGSGASGTSNRMYSTCERRRMTKTVSRR